MFDSIKNLFKVPHRCKDRVEIILLGPQRWISGNLHSCLKCGKLTDLGLDAQSKGEKVGNYYSLRKSLKLARELNKMGYHYDLMRMYKRKLGLRRSWDKKGFEFYEKEIKHEIHR